MNENDLTSIKEIARLTAGYKWRLAKWADDIAGRGLGIAMQEMLMILYSLESTDKELRTYGDSPLFARLRKAYNDGWKECKMGELIANVSLTGAKTFNRSEFEQAYSLASKATAGLCGDITHYGHKVIQEFSTWLGASPTSDWFYATEIKCLVVNILTAVEKLLSDFPEEYKTEFLQTCKQALMAPTGVNA